MAYRSISLRLTIWFSSVFFAGLVLFGTGMWLDLKDTLTSGRSRTLKRRADRLGDLLRDTQADSPAQRARKFRGFADATGGGLIEVFQIEWDSRSAFSDLSRAGIPMAPRHTDRS